MAVIHNNKKLRSKRDISKALSESYATLALPQYKRMMSNVAEQVIDQLPTTGTGYTATRMKFSTSAKQNLPDPPSRSKARQKQAKLLRRRGGNTGAGEQKKAINRVIRQIERLNIKRFARMVNRSNRQLGRIVVDSWYAGFIKVRDKGYQSYRKLVEQAVRRGLDE